MNTFEAKHGRPKPPPVNSSAYMEYQMAWQTIRVRAYPPPRLVKADAWLVDYWETPPGRWTPRFRRTHAEAVAYAHQLAAERRQP